MKKVFALLSIVAVFNFGNPINVFAQEPATEAETTEQVAPAEEAPVVVEEAVEEAVVVEEQGMHKALKQKFIEGGAGFMALVALCLIFGLALCIERIIYLSLASTNTKVLLAKIENALNEGGVEAALEVCRNTRGPIASIFYQGLSRYDEGVDVVERSVASYGGVQLGLLEKNLSWITLFISIGPSLGFMGTVIGMIQAFDQIQAAGDMSPALVAGGIKVALITTVGGLIVAMILQVFYNYCVSKIEGIVNSMEDASVSMLDILVKFAQKK
jgi:biopolymer transport protein ExbB